MQCIFSTFIEYQDISRDTFLLAKMILAAGGLMALSSYNNTASMFAILVKHLFLSLMAAGFFIQWQPRFIVFHIRFI